jgi:hypothetical protein
VRRVSEFLGTQHGHEQVDQERAREETDENVFHGDERSLADASAEFFTDGRVERAAREEGNRDAHENKIVHGRDDTAPRAIRLIKNRRQTIKKTLRRATRMLASLEFF